jgi:hypothetical protein
LTQPALAPVAVYSARREPLAAPDPVAHLLAAIQAAI